MRTILLATATLILSSLSLSAQGIVQTIRFKTDSQLDKQRELQFGFAEGYTNGVDFNREEHEIPAFPPEDFFVVFQSQIEQSVIQDKDIRAIPDSVLNEERERFSLDYEIHIRRFAGQKVTIEFRNPFPAGVDSIHVYDNFRILDHTFTAGQSEVLIPNDAITRVKMRVYYDLRKAGVEEESFLAGVSLFPNPAPATGSLRITGPIPSGTQAIVVDQLGRTISSQQLDGPGEIALPETPALYFVRLTGRGGRVLYNGSVAVVR